jgi:hypothetical protein
LEVFHGNVKGGLIVSRFGWERKKRVMREIRFFYEDGRGYKKLTLRLGLFVKEQKSGTIPEVGTRHCRSSRQMVDQR